jgi:hypothetical protein
MPGSLTLKPGEGGTKMADQQVPRSLAVAVSENIQLSHNNSSGSSRKHSSQSTSSPSGPSGRHSGHSSTAPTAMPNGRSATTIKPASLLPISIPLQHYLLQGPKQDPWNNLWRENDT